MKNLLLTIAALLTYGISSAQTGKEPVKTAEPKNPPVMTAPANPGTTPTLDTKKGVKQDAATSPVGPPDTDKTRAASPSGVERPATGNPNNPAATSPAK